MTFPDGRNATVKGDEILRSVWEMEIGESKWVDLWVIVGMVFVYRVMFWCVIKGAEKVRPVIRAILAASSKQRTNVEDPHNFS